MALQTALCAALNDIQGLWQILNQQSRELGKMLKEMP